MNADSLLAPSRNWQLKLYLLAALVYIGAFSLIAIPTLSRYHTAQVVKTQLSQYLKKDPAQNQAVALAGPPTSGTPVFISISRLGINLPIAPGFYSPATHTWTLNSKDVFTDNNIDPNPIISTDQSRVTFLYGHDIPGVLIKTSQLVYGDTMTIDTANGYQFEYYYDRSAVVPPTDSAILNQANTGDPVELMTCTGIWYQSRHVMYFHLLGVKKLAAAAISTGAST